MTGLVVGFTVAVALLGLLVAGLLRGHAAVLRTLHQMGVDLDPSTPGPGPVAVAAPAVRPTPGRPAATDVRDVVGVSPAGDAVSLAVAGVGHDTLLAFLTSGCSSCRNFWDSFRSGGIDVPGAARLAVVTRGPEAESPGVVAGLAGSAQVVMSTEAWQHYDIPYAPYFVYVSGADSAVVGEGVAAAWPEVRQLVANAVADGTTAPRRRGAHERSAADQRRDGDVDRQLKEAGILPGDPRLYPTAISDGGRQE